MKEKLAKLMELAEDCRHFYRKEEAEEYRQDQAKLKKRVEIVKIGSAYLVFQA